MPPAFTPAFADAVADAKAQVAATTTNTATPSVSLESFLIADATTKADVRQATVDATQQIVDDPQMNDASHAWYRHTKEDIEAHRDGITLDASGLGATRRYLGKSISASDAETAGEYWVQATRDKQTTAGAYVVLATPSRNDIRQQLQCGRVFQRLHLWATSQGLAVQPLNQLPERQDGEKQLGLTPTSKEKLRGFMDGRADLETQFIFRVGFPWDVALSSPRRPVDWVVEIGGRQ